VLIYNHNKELVAIDAETLHHLGYATLAAFLKSHRDVAELFVKKPGYIHNFRNFPWIDFVLHADAEESRAIVQNDKKHFSCSIIITPIYLADAPEREGYAVHLKHIKSLNDTPIEAVPTFSTPAKNTPPTLEPDYFDEEESAPLYVPENEHSEPSAEPDDTLEAYSPPTYPEEALPDETLYAEKAPVTIPSGDAYVYDPHIAADELGLPVELINEFVGDFIQQSHTFKQEIFDAALKEDYDEVHTLSHKLKGVAANLRIEDAFEHLSAINASRDQKEIETHLKQFYYIITKMEGGAPAEEQTDIETAPAASKTAEDDLYDFGDLFADTAKETPEASEEKPFMFDDEAGEKEPLPIEDTRADKSPLLLREDDPSEERSALFSEAASPVSEETPEEEGLPEEAPVPFGKEIFPDEARSIVEKAAAAEYPRQISGDRAHDAELAPEPEFEPLHYRPETAAAEIGLDLPFIRNLVSDFVKDATARKPEIQEAIAHGDVSKVHAFAFEFKGLSDNLRIEQLSHSLGKMIRYEQAEALKRETNRFYALLKQL